MAGLAVLGLVACSPEAGGLGSATASSDPTTGGSGADPSGSTADPLDGTGSSTTDDPSTSGAASTGPEPEPVCGNRLVEADEDCDDANGDETDGCLSTCVAPRSCAHALEQIPGARDDTYRLWPDGSSLDTWCDMSEGGWTLVAKVNPATQNAADPATEPTGWFAMTLDPEQLEQPDLITDEPVASHGAARFSGLLGGSSVARFELIAADDHDTIVHWYKRVASPQSFETWFGDEADTASEVCIDPEFTMACEMGTISSFQSPYTRLQGMNLADYGYSRGDVIHMRLSGDSGSGYTSICSSTHDDDGNAWPDSYGQHWGNALRIWLQE